MRRSQPARPLIRGRRYDQRLLAELLLDVDPCGERGEFHSFVYSGPIIDRPIEIEVGEPTFPRRLRLLRPARAIPRLR
jgi:diphthamide synthase (EF-2-diphthine--ammonia ligase)